MYTLNEVNCWFILLTPTLKQSQWMKRDSKTVRVLLYSSAYFYCLCLFLHQFGGWGWGGDV
jgi:hypothetical protein